MLLPASCLLLTVLALPMLQHQWAIVVYTFGVILLGFFLYAALQLARKLRVPFFHNADVSCDVWTPGAVVASFAALPAFLVGVVLYCKLDLPFGEVLAVVLSLGCLMGLVAWGLVQWVGHAQELPDDPLDFSQRPSSHLLSIPEVGERDSMMTAFLHDSVVHTDTGAWTSPPDR
jgi:hypothetical protein